jgi:hypothetical protein
MSSDDGDSKSVLEALDRVLEELRREFASNPEFAHRVVRALGANVVFDPKHAAKLINPIELVANGSPASVTEKLGALSAADLKKMAKDSKLASPGDVAGKSKDDVIKLIQKRAQIRIDARRSDD